jgi:hypothetical protein
VVYEERKGKEGYKQKSASSTATTFPTAALSPPSYTSLPYSPSAFAPLPPSDAPSPQHTSRLKTSLDEDRKADSGGDSSADNLRRSDAEATRTVKVVARDRSIVGRRSVTARLRTDSSGDLAVGERATAGLGDGARDGRARVGTEDRAEFGDEGVGAVGADGGGGDGGEGGGVEVGDGREGEVGAGGVLEVSEEVL